MAIDMFYAEILYVGIYIHLSMPPFISAQVVHERLLCREMTRHKSNRLQKTPHPVILIALLNELIKHCVSSFQKEKKTLNAYK